MPPRRQVEKEVIFVEMKPLLVSKYLMDNYWQMLDKLDIKPECPVCLEKIVDKHSFALCVCGHSLHFDCRHWSNNPEMCPVCKYGFQRPPEDD